MDGNEYAGAYIFELVLPSILLHFDQTHKISINLREIKATILCIAPLAVFVGFSFAQDQEFVRGEHKQKITTNTFLDYTPLVHLSYDVTVRVDCVDNLIKR